MQKKTKSKRVLKPICYMNVFLIGTICLHRLFLACIFTALVSTAFIFGISLYQFIAYFVDKQAIKGGTNKISYLK